MTQTNKQSKLKRPSKYGAARPVYKGKKYDSGLEMLRFRRLEEAEKKGIISELRTQQPYVLVPKQKVGDRIERPVKYVADFVYVKDGALVVEDTKGIRTAMYVIKRKLMLKVHGIVIKEVNNPADEI